MSAFFTSANFHPPEIVRLEVAKISCREEYSIDITLVVVNYEP